MFNGKTHEINNNKWQFSIANCKRLPEGNVMLPNSDFMEMCPASTGLG